MEFVVYILELEGGFYYVGRTKELNLPDRLDAHKKGHGSKWTSLHRPTHVRYIYHTDDIFREDLETKRLMLIYGIDRVRGGAYSRECLPEFQIRALEYELRGCEQLCYRCGSNTHFIAQCPTRG